MFSRVGSACIFSSSRTGGVSQKPYDTLNIAQHVGDNPNDVKTNREILEAEIANENLGPIDEWIFLNQTHEPNVFVINQRSDSSNEPPTADAAITTTKNLPLVVMTADCGPLVIVGESIIAVVHASWRTIKDGLIQKTLKRMKELAPNQKFQSILGPCIRPANYEFERSLLEDLADVLGDHVISKTNDEKPAFDLPCAISNICIQNDCQHSDTAIDTFSKSEYFSYRRDGKTGRQATVAWLD